MPIAKNYDHVSCMTAWLTALSHFHRRIAFLCASPYVYMRSHKLLPSWSYNIPHPHYNRNHRQLYISKGLGDGFFTLFFWMIWNWLEFISLLAPLHHFVGFEFYHFIADCGFSYRFWRFYRFYCQKIGFHLKAKDLSIVEYGILNEVKDLMLSQISCDSCDLIVRSGNLKIFGLRSRLKYLVSNFQKFKRWHYPLKFGKNYS